jgi:hypothetical protein
MDPITLGVVALLFIGIVVLLVGAFIVRAWIRTVKWLARLAFYGTLAALVCAGVGAGVVWVLYGEQLRAMWAAAGG